MGGGPRRLDRGAQRRGNTARGRPRSPRERRRAPTARHRPKVGDRRGGPEPKDRSGPGPPPATLVAMTTRNTFAAVAFGAATLFLANGCGSRRGIFGEIHTMSVEVTGTGAKASELTYHLLSNDGTERAVALPWKQSAEGEFVPVSVTASAPAGTTVTCRIV